MGTMLRANSADTRVTLRARHLVGRSRSCCLQLIESSVSGEHASIRWNGTEWRLRDLGSTNGTFLHDVRVPSGSSVLVTEGSRVRFGHTETWLVESCAPPVAMAVCTLDGRQVFGSEDLLALPSEDHPIATLYTRQDGSWNAEFADDQRAVDDLDVLQLEGVSWRLHLPVPLTDTVDPSLRSVVCLPNVSMHFRVTLDEEHVELCVRAHGREVHLPNRAHLYALLVLARLRVDEQDQQLPEPGWIDRDWLCRQLGVTRLGLNTQFHRARLQLADAGVHGTGQLLQRRGGKLRLVAREITVARLA